MNILKLAALGALAGGVDAAKTDSEDIRNLRFVNPNVCEIPRTEYSGEIYTEYLKASACTKEIKPDWATREDIYSFEEKGTSDCLAEWDNENFCMFMKDISLDIAKDLSENAEKIVKRYFEKGEFSDKDIVTAKLDKFESDCASYEDDNGEECKAYVNEAKAYSKNLIRILAQEINKWTAKEGYVVPADRGESGEKSADLLFDEVCEEIGRLSGTLSDDKKAELKSSLQDAVNDCKQKLHSYYGEPQEAAEEICKYVLYYAKDGGEYVFSNVKNYLSGLEVTKGGEQKPAWAIAIGAIGVAFLITGCFFTDYEKKILCFKEKEAKGNKDNQENHEDSVNSSISIQEYKSGLEEGDGVVPENNSASNRMNFKSLERTVVEKNVNTYKPRSDMEAVQRVNSRY